MNVSDLIDAFRSEINDTAKPYLVSPQTALRYLNEAQTEAARRAHLIVDSTNLVDGITVTPGDPLVDIDPRIIAIRRIRLDSRTEPLIKRQARGMDECYPGWDAETNQSTPVFAVLDYETNKIRLHPIPSTEDMLRMTVFREPIKPLVNDTDVPEIATRWHFSLIEWMKFRTYSNDDTELYDMNKAARAIGLFEQEFGPKRSATDEAFEYAEYHDIGEL